jgi:hypothetical protein
MSKTKEPTDEVDCNYCIMTEYHIIKDYLKMIDRRSSNIKNFIETMVLKNRDTIDDLTDDLNSLQDMFSFLDSNLKILRDCLVMEE